MALPRFFRNQLAMMIWCGMGPARKYPTAQITQMPQ